MGSSLNQRTAEFSLCNTLVLLLDLSFKQTAQNLGRCASSHRRFCGLWGSLLVYAGSFQLCHQALYIWHSPLLDNLST